MKGIRTKANGSRVLSFLLTLVMVFSLMPVTKAEAAEESLVVTDMHGDEADEFLVGEPIMVTAESDASGAWVGLFSSADATGGSWFWYYVDGSDSGKSWDSGETYNIYETVPWGAGEENNFIPAGTYYIRLLDTGAEPITKEIKLVNPDEYSLEVKEDTIVAGESISVKAIHDTNQSWVGIYEGTKTTADTFGKDYKYSAYLHGHSGEWREIPMLTAGDYTVVLFGDGGYDKPEICVPVTVEEAEEEIVLLSTDKEEYEYGEPIMVTGYQNDSKTWVGLYKKGETYDPGAGGSYSIFWCYLADVNSPVDITKTRDENGRGGEFKAGDYKVVLFFNDSYTPAAEVEFTVTKDVVGEPVRVEPTCTEAGSITTTYTDGTTDVEPIEKLGHDWAGWEYDKEAKTHSRVCGRDASHTENGSCEFDEGVVTTEPTETTAGEKTFTCEICEGTYTTVIPAAGKVVDREEITTPATCEGYGEKTIYYTDGSSTTEPIAPLNHAWSKWASNGDLTHSRVCANDETHKETGNCERAATGTLTDGVMHYDCTVCGGEVKSVVYVQTDKRIYFVGEPILVTSEYIDSASPWVGLYEATADPNAVGASSLLYYYRGADRVVDLMSHSSIVWQRQSDFTAGEYKVVLMSTDVLPYKVEAEYYFTVVNAEEVSRKVTEPTCTEQGYTTIYYANGTSQKVDFVPALNHSWSEWSFDAETKHHSRVCGRDASHTENNACTFDEGVVTTEPTATTTGEKTFTCTVCDGAYTVEIPATTVTVVGKEITTAPTCDDPGEYTITYSDGTTGTEPIAPLGHAYGKFVMDENKTSHTKVCANDATHKITEDCTPDSGVLTDGAMVYSCTVCEGVMSETLIIKTDKTEYKYGEPIMVSTQFASDYAPWIGLYKKGDIYGDVAGAVKSIFWAYISEMPVVNGVPTVDIRTTRDENSRSSEFVAGDYRVYVFDQDSYFEMGYYDFTVTKELTSTETKAADCENDGYVKEYYSDGTSEIVSTTPKLNHEWSTWAYDAATKTHARTCGNDAAHKEAGNCSFNGGVVTTEPTDTADGVKTFTCTVCEGTYTEAIPATGKVVDRTETILAPGCETAGTLRTYYTDGTYIDTAISGTGHAYGDTWTYNNDKATHSRVCGNDASHIENAPCTFEGVADGDGVLYTCSVCGGSYSTAILTSDKDVYSLDDPVYVTAFCENDYSWVGLYEKEDAYDPNNNGEVSEQWYYVVDSAAGVNNSGKPVNIMDSAYKQTDVSANGVTNGEYKLVLFGDGNYGQVLATKYIAFDTNMDNTTFTVKVNGEAAANGSSVNLKLEDSAVINVTADGTKGTSWVGVYTKKLGIDTDFTTVGTSDWWAYLKDCSGTDVNLKEKLGAKYTYGDFSVVVYADGGYSDVRQVVNIKVAKEAVSSQVIEEPTCENYGSRLDTYADGTSAIVPIEPLNHKWGGWVFNANTHKHTHTCERDAQHTETAACEFGEGVVTREPDGVVLGERTFTCGTCNGTYIEYFSYTEGETVVERVWGTSRYDTALNIADRMKDVEGVEKFDNVIVANGTGFADALSGSYLAKVKNAPILISGGAKEAAVKEYIKNNVKEGGTVYVLGGFLALPESLERDLQDTFTVKRLSGVSRYDTNLAILEEAGMSGDEILVCTGENYADSLSASALGKPILMVKKSLTDAQKDYLNANRGKKLYIIGGNLAVNEEIEAGLQSYGSTMRIYGTSRFDTSVKVAKTFVNDPSIAVIASGLTFPDGLCGGPLAQSLNAPLILTANYKEASAVEYLRENGIDKGVVLGGNLALSDECVETLFGTAAN